MLDLKPARIASVLLVCLSGLAGSPAKSDEVLPPRIAANSAAVVTAVDRGDRYSRSCRADVHTADVAGHLWVETVTGPDGNLDSWLAVGGWGDSQLYLRASASALNHEAVLLEGDPRHASFTDLRNGEVARDDSILRIVWAGWRTAVACRVEVNGHSKKPTTLRNEVSYTAVSQMQTGVGVDASALHAGGPAIEELISSGFFVGWFFGDFLVETPRGEILALPTFVAQEVPGYWRITLADKASTEQFPAYYSLNLGPA